MLFLSLCCLVLSSRSCYAFVLFLFLFLLILHHFPSPLPLPFPHAPHPSQTNQEQLLRLAFLSFVLPFAFNNVREDFSSTLLSVLRIIIVRALLTIQNKPALEVRLKILTAIIDKLFHRILHHHTGRVVYCPPTLWRILTIMLVLMPVYSYIASF